MVSSSMSPGSPGLQADGRLESSRSQLDRSVMFFLMCFNINAINIYVYIYIYMKRERERD